MTTRKRPPRAQGDELPCGQTGCYSPESARDLRWCMYANYWRYGCQKPDGVDVIPPTAATPAAIPGGQIGVPARIPAGPKADPPTRDQEQEIPPTEEDQPEGQKLEEAPAQIDEGEGEDASDEETTAQPEPQTPGAVNSAPEPVEAFQTSFAI